jgi:hypothetical protein
MQRKENATEDQSIGLVDAIKVVAVSHLNLYVEFEDGVRGNVEIAQSWLTGVFALLNDPNEFKKVFVCHGAVTWESGLDLAPDSMHAAIKKNGRYLLS